MVKKKIGAEVSPVAASQEPVPALAEATGATDRGVQAYLLDLTFASTMPGARSLSKEEQVKQIAVLVELLRSMGPQDAMESLLTSQMVAVYSAAMDCLRRAAIPEQPSMVRDQNLRHAQRLAALYARQMETLDKHRGKGQQKVTVEYVNVEAGGRAIVGNVEAEKPRPSLALSPPPGNGRFAAGKSSERRARRIADEGNA